MNVMLYLLNNNSLPWDNFHHHLKKKKEKYEFKDLLKERLKVVYSQKLYLLIPDDLKPMFRKVFTLSFDEMPNYAEMVEAVTKELHKEIKILYDMELSNH